MNLLSEQNFNAAKVVALLTVDVRNTAVCEFMRYSYLQKPHLERGREFKVSPICLRTAVHAGICLSVELFC